MLLSLTAMKLIKVNSRRTLVASAIVGRFLIITTSAFGIATVANWTNHKSYWEGTIFRVQTTDFNILSHTLPTKLSYVLQKGDRVELQRTLNSNYGLFGIVVTNCTTTAIECPNQKVLHLTESTRSWKQQLRNQDLSQHPYDLLRDPPPLVTEGGFENSRDQTWKVTRRVNRGKIVGRVYYIRGIPPEFWADYLGWLKELPASLLSDRGAYRYYALTVGCFLSGGLAAWGVIEWILFRKRLQKHLAQQEKQRLLEEAWQLQEQLIKQLQQQEYLLSELKHNRSEQEKLSNLLAQKIAQYENELKQKDVANQHNIQNLKNLEHELQEIQKRQVEDEEQLQQREQAITNLQINIKIQQHEKQQTDESLKQLQYVLQTAQRKLISTSSRVQSLDNSIASLTQERDSATHQVKQLEYELENVRGSQFSKITALTEALKTAKAESEEFEKHIIQENEQLSGRIVELQHDKEKLEAKCLQIQLQVKNLEEKLKSLRANQIDLSHLRLALVGGHQDVRRHVIQELEAEHGLQRRNVVEILPEENFNERRLRTKIGNCALVIILTYRCSHPLRNQTRALANEVLELPPSCHGRNDAFRRIMQYVMNHPRLLQR
jgi:hypothetical protein